MAATNDRETTATQEPPRSTASPLDQHAPPTATQAGRSGRATASMVLGIISIPAALLTLLGLIIGVVGLVLGVTAKSDIDRRGLTNRGQAVAGIVLSSIGLVLAVANMIAGAIIATS
jgi:Domain of unknown function (DUF4190)